jgi:hypothetical protein
MKTIISILLAMGLTFSSVPAFANGHHYRNVYKTQHHHRHGPVIVQRDNWVAPLIGGVILGAVIADSKEKEQKQVIVQPAPVTVTKVIVCSEWKEIMTSDGQVYKERTCREQ